MIRCAFIPNLHSSRSPVGSELLSGCVHGRAFSTPPFLVLPYHAQRLLSALGLQLFSYGLPSAILPYIFCRWSALYLRRAIHGTTFSVVSTVFFTSSSSGIAFLPFTHAISTASRYLFYFILSLHSITFTDLLAVTILRVRLICYDLIYRASDTLNTFSIYRLFSIYIINSFTFPTSIYVHLLLHIYNLHLLHCSHMESVADLFSILLILSCYASRPRYFHFDFRSQHSAFCVPCLFDHSLA